MAQAIVFIQEILRSITCKYLTGLDLAGQASQKSVIVRLRGLLRVVDNCKVNRRITPDT